MLKPTTKKILLSCLKKLFSWSNVDSSHSLSITSKENAKVAIIHKNTLLTRNLIELVFN